MGEVCIRVRGDIFLLDSWAVQLAILGGMLVKSADEIGACLSFRRARMIDGFNVISILRY